MKIQINDQNFILHYSGAMFWQEQKMLLISDVHLGKVAHFRKHGLAIPERAILENFIKLDALLEIFDAEIIVFLGDLFHSKINNEWNFFAEWIASISQKIILVEGNHDIISKQKYADLNIEVLSELIIDGFLLTHHPTEQEGFYNFCGHVHPGIKLKGLGRQYLNLPCFFRKSNQMIFPAFGTFTGKFTLVPTEKDTIYAITKEEVFDIRKN